MIRSQTPHKKKRLIFFLLFLSIFFDLLATNYEDGYTDKFLYIHPFLNYNFNSDWYNRWEANYFAGQGFLFNVGSVTTHELLVDGSLVINQSLGKGWRFRGEGRWLDTHHLKNQEKSVFMGLEKRVIDYSSIYLIVNPAYDKEFTALNMGFLFADSSYKNYLRLGLLWEDFVYDEKNNLDGVSDKIPLSMQWYARYNWKQFIAYTEGRLSQGFERQYTNQELSPEITAHDLLWNNIRAKLYYIPSDQSMLCLSFYHYYFDETKKYYTEADNYSYQNTISQISLDYMQKYKDLNRFRLQLQYIKQDAQSEGYSAHRFNRGDFLSAISYERFIFAHTLELQYMFALPQWEYNGLSGNPQNYDASEKVDKIKIGWTYTFPQGAKFYISLSHEVQSGDFGGANLFYIMLF